MPGGWRTCCDATRAGCPREPDHVEIDYSHGRIIKRSLWAADAADMDFPHVTRAVRIRRDGYDAAGTVVSKETVHAVTSLREDRAGPAGLGKIARGQWAAGHGHLQEHRDQPGLVTAIQAADDEPATTSTSRPAT
jgi:hypothetical protein